MITQSELKQVLHYEPETGVFTWLTNHAHGSKKFGVVAGYKLASGHIRIKVVGKSYPAHRLAWLYMTGEHPPTEHVDHINLVRNDNRWSNLRLATSSENCANKRKLSINRSGWKGVNVSRGKWRASIKHNGKYKHLGLYDCPAAASFAYQIAADRLFGAYSRAF